MRRRRFLSALGGTVAAWPLAARARRPQQRPRISVLFPLAANDPEQMERRAGLQQGLERAGLVDGRTAQIEYHYAARQARFQPLAQEVVALKPDVIFVQSTGFAAAVHRETRTIPVVFANVSDPIGSGFVESLARPGSNFTGMLLFEDGVAAKWVALLKEIAPSLKRAVLIADPNVTPLDYFLGRAEAAAGSLGTEVTSTPARDAEAIESAISVLAAPSDGLVITPSSTMLLNRALIIGLAARHRLPAVFPERVYAVDGGLISYGIADLIEPFRQAATYIARILDGEKPADLPVQGPTRYTTIVNARTANALGLTVPPSILARADEVIE